VSRTRPHPPQDRFRQWLDEQGIKHAWAARRIGYTSHYLSRVLRGQNPLSDQFRRRCEERLGAPADVWTQ
jgi:plasmid maintenance system antidote protein VapI